MYCKTYTVDIYIYIYVLYYILTEKGKVALFFSFRIQIWLSFAFASVVTTYVSRNVFEHVYYIYLQIYCFVVYSNVRDQTNEPILEWILISLLAIVYVQFEINSSSSSSSSTSSSASISLYFLIFIVSKPFLRFQFRIQFILCRDFGFRFPTFLHVNCANISNGFPKHCKTDILLYLLKFIQLPSHK